MSASWRKALPMAASSRRCLGPMSAARRWRAPRMTALWLLIAFLVTIRSISTAALRLKAAKHCRRSLLVLVSYRPLAFRRVARFPRSSIVLQLSRLSSIASRPRGMPGHTRRSLWLLVAHRDTIQRQYQSSRASTRLLKTRPCARRNQRAHIETQHNTSTCKGKKAPCSKQF